MAQSIPPPLSNISCKINTATLTDADIAFNNEEKQKAADLYAALLAQDAANDLARYRQIQSLIDLQKISEANRLTEAWASASSSDAWAVLAAGSLRLGKGDVVEGYALIAKAAKLNPCIADVYQGMALFEEIAGYHAAARKHLALGHQLDPLNDRLSIAWIDSLPQPEQLIQMERLINSSVSMDEKRRAYQQALLDRKRALSKADCHLVSNTSTVTLPMTPIFVGQTPVISGYGLEIAFNGVTRVLRLDSGVTGLILTADAAGGLGLKMIDKTHLALVGKQQRSLVSDLRSAVSVKIAGIAFTNCPVTVFNDPYYMSGGIEMARAWYNLSGLVGSDFFAHYLVTLDYVKHEVRLEPLPRRPDDTTLPDRLDAMGAHLDADPTARDPYIPPSMQGWAKVYRSSHNLLIPTRIGSMGSKLFLYEIGSGTSVISPQAAKEVTTIKKDVVPSYIGGTNDRARDGFQTGELTLDFAGVRLPQRTMASVDLSEFSLDAGVGVSGFIGYPALEQLIMHLDYRDNLVFFEAPTPKK